MRSLVRAAAVLAAATLAAAMVPAASHATGNGNDSKSTQGAQTQQGAADTFVDRVPCATDTGLFEITLAYNSTERFAQDERGHFTGTGTFSALPVTVLEWLEEVHDDHVHLIAVSWEPREGASYSGRFTSNGTMNNNPSASTAAFTFQVKGTSSDGERISAHETYHEIVSQGVTRTVSEPGGLRCG